MVFKYSGKIRLFPHFCNNFLIKIIINFFTAIQKYCEKALGCATNAICEDFKAVSGFGLQCKIQSVDTLVEAATSSDVLLNAKNLTNNYITQFG